MPYGEIASPWQPYLRALTRLVGGIGVPERGVHVALGEALCSTWGVTDDLSDDAARVLIRDQFAAYVSRLTFSQISKQHRSNYMGYAPVVLPIMLNLDDPWLDLGIEGRRRRAIERLSDSGHGIVSEEMVRRCVLAALEDIARQIVSTAAALKFGMLSRVEASHKNEAARDLYAAGRDISIYNYPDGSSASPPAPDVAGGTLPEHQQLQAFLLRLAEILELENSSQAALLVARGTLPVPWTTAKGESGTTARELALYFADMEVPQVIVLGEPGSGKTTMATLLIAELNTIRGKKPILDPIPVRLSIATWNPYATGIYEWMLGRMADEYPPLIPVLSDIACLGLSDLLIRRWILPVLDGFDEMEDHVRPLAFSKLATEFMRQQVIVTSRVAEFVGLRGTAPFLPGSAEMIMRPVLPEDSLEYFSAAAPTVGAAVWAKVFGTPAQETSSALSSPLTIWLLAYICSADHTDPRELLALPDAESVRARLLQGLVPAAMGRIQGTRGHRGGAPIDRASPEEAEASLSWLAYQLERRGAVTISWWEIHRLIPRTGLILAAAIVAGAVTGVTMGTSLLSVSLPVALSLGAFFGFGCGRGYSSARKKGMESMGRTGYGGINAGADPELRPHLYRLTTALLAIALLTATGEATARLIPRPLVNSDTFPVTPGAMTGIMLSAAVVAIACCIAAMAIGVLIGVFLRSTKKIDEKWGGARGGTPREAVRRDGLNTLRISTLTIGTCAISALLIFFRYSNSLPELALVTAVTILSPITASFVQTEWLKYRVAHLWLVLCGRIPLSFMSFLEEAHRVGVLRQTGLSYDFRHELLRKSLASTYRNRETQAYERTVPGRRQ